MKNIIVESLDMDKAQDIETIAMSDDLALADYMVIASGTSTRQVMALASKLKDRLSARGCSGIRVEGAAQGDWIIVDAGDVIVHLFRPEVRSFYNLEKIWRDFGGVSQSPKSEVHIH